jgi:acyl dehydratase
MYYFNSQATRDGIRHYVHGMGDNNPLFTNEDYARKTKYGNIIAPGSYLYTIMWSSLSGGLPGLHEWYSGGDWEWYRPIFMGDEFKAVNVVRDLVIKKGRSTGGNIYIDYGDVIYVNQNGEIVGKELYHGVWVEREASGSAGKYLATTKPVFDKEDWIRILEAYDKEELIGSKPRYWEDVEVGEMLGPMIKGPLSVRDEIAWLLGAGSPFFRAHKLEFEFEMRHPKALEHVRELDETDVPELVHIFDEYARAIGIERAYDYGCQRMSWLCNLFTNWMGDNGFLWKMSGDLRVFNQIGDTTTFEGKVIKKYIDEGKYCVDIEAWAKNQRGEWSMPPRTSTVILPSTQYGAVIYPSPLSHIAEEIKKARPLDEMIKEGLI